MKAIFANGYMGKHASYIQVYNMIKQAASRRQVHNQPAPMESIIPTRFPTQDQVPVFRSPAKAATNTPVVKPDVAKPVAPKKVSIPKSYASFYPDSALWYATVMAESSNNPDAVGDKGRAKGIVQIRPGVIADVNKAFKTDYTHDDAFDVAKAREIYNKYVALYGRQYMKRTGKAPTSRIKAQIWNGGPRGDLKQNAIDYSNRLAKKLAVWDQYKWNEEDKKNILKLIEEKKFFISSK